MVTDNQLAPFLLLIPFPMLNLARTFSLTCLFALLCVTPAFADAPNVLVILSDDAGYADFGFTHAHATRLADGNPNADSKPLVPTPNLDRLAARGVVCTQAYVTASTCTPSRMGLMSGRYQQRFGAECNVPTKPTPGFTKEDLGLDTSQSTMGTKMAAAGYRTMAIGKWHLGELPKYHPNERGFDEFYGFLGGSRTYWPVAKPRHANAIRRNDDPVNEIESIEYLTDDLTDAAIEFMARDDEKPFFIYLAYNAVHSPFEATEEDLEQVGVISPPVRQKVAAMTKSMDDNIGRMMNHLEENGLADKTLVVFLNDNGGTQGNAHDNGDLRGFKGTYWEGGIRIPMIVSWPDRLPQGTSYDHPVSALDLMPTCLAASDRLATTTTPMDGVNLLPFLCGESNTPPHEFLFWRFWRIAAVRHGKWKLIRVAENPLSETRELLAPLMLFDLENDPTETSNVARTHPDQTNDLLERLQKWETGLTQPRWYDGSRWQHWQKAQLINHAE